MNTIHASPSLFARLKEWARALRRDVHALYFAARDPRVSWQAKALAACVAAYALSPIDLIPDFIPVLGYLDDLVIVPLGIWFAVTLIPPGVMRDCRERAVLASSRPTSCAAAVAIIAIWVVAGIAAGIAAVRLLGAGSAE